MRGVGIVGTDDNPGTVGRIGRRPLDTVRAPLSECLDGIEDPEAVADASDAYFFESDLIQFEDDISSDIARPECEGVMAAFDVGEPGRNVRVGPGA